MKTKKFKLKPRKAVVKRIRVTKTGKLLRSHQLRTSHLRRKKSKQALRRQAKSIEVSKSERVKIKRMLGI